MNKFFPKLDKAAQHQVAAAVHSGRWPMEVVCQLFDISYSTARHFRYLQRNLYANVHQSIADMGRDEFIAAHLSEGVARQLDELATKHRRTIEARAEARRRAVLEVCDD